MIPTAEGDKTMSDEFEVYRIHFRGFDDEKRDVTFNVQGAITITTTEDDMVNIFHDKKLIFACSVYRFEYIAYGSLKP